MVAHSVSDIGNLIVKSGPWKKPFYLAKRSFPPGVTPKHLEGYATAFGTAARDCKGIVSGLKGREHVQALRGCIGQKLRR